MSFAMSRIRLSRRYINFHVQLDCTSILTLIKTLKFCHLAKPWVYLLLRAPYIDAWAFLLCFFVLESQNFCFKGVKQEYHRKFYLWPCPQLASNKLWTTCHDSSYRPVAWIFPADSRFGLVVRILHQYPVLAVESYAVLPDLYSGSKMTWKVHQIIRISRTWSFSLQVIHFTRTGLQAISSSNCGSRRD